MVVQGHGECDDVESLEKRGYDAVLVGSLPSIRNCVTYLNWGGSVND